MNKSIVIGSGVAGLSSAAYLAKKGHKVTVLEKNSDIGGRARMFEANGFNFDMGPSWYWMPEVFEDFFNDFGRSTSDFYSLEKLPENFKVFFEDTSYDVPNNSTDLKDLFETIEPGSGSSYDKFMEDAKFKYNFAFEGLIYQPGLSLMEYMDGRLIKNVVKHKVFHSFRKHVYRYFKSDKIRLLMEFPVLFLGAAPQNTPALYSLMNYAGYELGTWYPMGGMHQLIEAMKTVALDQGVEFKTDCEIDHCNIENHTLTKLKSSDEEFIADNIVSTMDYQHFDQFILPKTHREYSPKYWDKRALAPSSLLFYLGINKKVDGLRHHNLFFDTDLDQHSSEIYDDPQWPADPLFYVCCPSKTDPSVAPEGHENLFILMPLAPGIEDRQDLRDSYFEILLNRLEKKTGASIKDHIVFKRDYCVKDFQKDYHSFKGNAYGLANTINQTGYLKPKIRSSKIRNLYHAGQLTVPGPGLPPSIISGKIVSTLIH